MWTDEMVDRLVSYWKNGLTATEIGEFFNKTRNAVLGKLNRLGLLADGSHQPGIGGFRRKPKKHKIAPQVLVPPVPKRRAKGAGRSLASLGAVPPPPMPIPIKSRPSTWLGIVAALDALQDGECHWPVPEGREKPVGFCGAPVASGEGQPYCEYHRIASCNGNPGRIFIGKSKNWKF